MAQDKTVAKYIVTIRLDIIAANTYGDVLNDESSVTLTQQITGSSLGDIISAYEAIPKDHKR
jgi:hypothetical protein